MLSLKHTEAIRLHQSWIQHKSTVQVYLASMIDHTEASKIKNIFLTLAVINAGVTQPLHPDSAHLFVAVTVGFFQFNAYTWPQVSPYHKLTQLNKAGVVYKTLH